MNTFTAGISGLFPQSQVQVIGIPSDFDIVAGIEKADSVRIAMAFCHMTGWQKLLPGIEKCKGAIQLITGLDFCQTEPKLLREWHRLAVNSNFRPRLMTCKAGIFHPKVMIVSGLTYRFALVGSGNLSEGGLRTNVECFIYTAEDSHILQLVSWFNDLFQQAHEFGEDDIRAYEPKYKKVRQAVSNIQKQQKKVEQIIADRQIAFLAQRQQAVKRAKQDFQKTDFADGWQKRKDSTELMKRLLHYPTFDFSKEEWKKFYGVYELGHLIPIYRDRVFRQEKRLKEALRLLIDETKPIGDRLKAVLDRGGSHAISGLRINTVSKILAVHDPSRWPVYNSPVATTLRHFGYQPPRGGGLAGKYEAYAKLMQEFMKECSARDVYALDWFFYWFAQEKKGAKPKT